MIAAPPATLTPIERHGGYWVKRDDLYEAYGQRGGKARTANCLITSSLLARRMVVTAGNRHSPQVEIVSGIAAALGFPCEVHVPDGAETPQTNAARVNGARVVRHRPGYNSVIVSRAAQAAVYYGGLYVPFGMECAEAIAETAAQVAHLPPDVARIVIPVGSGMSLAGVVAGLEASGRATPVLGVKVGAEPGKRLSRWMPPLEHPNVVVTLTPAHLPYGRPPAITVLGSLRLDPVYEAHCLPYLTPGDLLWVVGIRGGGVQ